MDRDATRAVSSALFNNGKFIEVIVAIHRYDRPTFTTQEIAREVNINPDLVKKVIDRLETVELVKRQERLIGSRGPLPFEVQQGPAWDALVALTESVTAAGG